MNYGFTDIGAEIASYILLMNHPWTNLITVLCCLFYLRSAHRTVAGLRVEAMAIPFSISDTGLDLVPGIPCPEFNKHYYEHIILEFPIGHLIQIYNWIDRPAMRLWYQRLWVTISSVIVCKPYRTSKGFYWLRRFPALSAQALCRTRA